MKTRAQGLTAQEREDRRRLWWDKKELGCTECEGQYTLERSDIPHITGVEVCGALIINVFFTCTNCETKMRFDDYPKNNNDIRDAAIKYNNEHPPNRG